MSVTECVTYTKFNFIDSANVNDFLHEILKKDIIITVKVVAMASI